MSDARGAAAGSDHEGDDPHAEEEEVPVEEAEAAALARGGGMTPDAESESDDGEGDGSPDREEDNAVSSGGGNRATVAGGHEEREGIVGATKVETNGEDVISHDGGGEGDEDDDGGDEDDDDDDGDDSTPDASPRAEVKVEGESSTGMAPSEASHRVEPDPFLDGYDSGTEEDQAAFMVELERFHREQGLEFKPPKFYGKGLNCLKCASFNLSRLSELVQLYANISRRLNLLALSKSRLWRQVAHLGGHDQVTVCKLWRQVGETFRPPKTCTTVSWSFRIFYEKALLEYEKYKVRTGQLQVPPPTLLPAGGTDHESSQAPHHGSLATGNGSSTDRRVLLIGECALILTACTPHTASANLLDEKMGANQSSSARVRRDAAARAMQGWHAQRLVANGTYGDQILKDKDSIPLSSRGKNLKGFGVLKRKKASSPEYTPKLPRGKEDSMVTDIGEPADWVKINVRQTKDCFEVYALVPGLLREEVHVQSDPAGRLVITGDPDQPDNPWGITPFKKVVNLPSRIDPHQTSAVVTLHGQLFVRAPFGQADM
ncbi:hypothetical protein PR202_gb09555 [Eleusine coracana subsp. coracana]|uniref:AT-rich interactive domain-containing protein 3 n=1 Tax=Eleusine coracana subsp. coracana TaxID=191504 RepID=A0AAV5EHQ1_ELECO|nr:hypothetical protein PR202_gb09555 [Eleusine coracana subsp. coracana]